MEHPEIFCQIRNLPLAAIMNWKLIAVVSIAAVLLMGLILYYNRRNKIPPFQPPAFIPPPGELYVANMGGHSLLGFDRGLNGQVNTNTTVRVISGPATGLHNPIDIALKESGEIWVLNLGDPPGSNPSITVYEPNANGNATPLFNLSLISPFGIASTVVPGALDRRFNSDNFFVCFCNDNSVDEVNVMNNNLHVVETITVPSSMINPTGLAASANRLFVAVSALPLIFGLYQVPASAVSAILIFEIQSDGTWGSSPAATISGNATGLRNPAHICSDSSGNLFVLNRGSFGAIENMSILVFDTTQPGNVAPTRIIAGPDTNLNQPFNPYGMTVDADGWIYVSGLNSILVFSPQAQGNVSPDRTIHSQHLSSPMGLEVR